MYQADKPLIPFLACDLEKLLRAVMNRFLKESTVSSAKTFTQLAKIDVSLDQNRKNSKDVDIGLITRRELNELKQNGKISSEQKKCFEFDCKAFLTCTAQKLLEKCPLKFPLVRFLRCLDPRVMGGSSSACVKLFELLLNSLLDARRIPEANVDVLKREYASFVQEVHNNPRILQQFQNYDVSEQRVDCFLASHLKNSQHQMLWELISVF